jgi:hypothetical protein
LVCFFTCMEPVAEGAACDGMKRQCPETLVCFNYKCSPPARQGAACNPNADNCERDRGFFCESQKKVCTPYAMAGVGSACNGGIICKAGQCADAPAMSKCVANANDGAQCDTRKGPGCSAPARCVAGLCKLPDPASCD